MKKSIFTFAVAIAALSYAGSASAHPINPFRHLSDIWSKTEAPQSEKTLSTAHPGKTVALSGDNGGRKTVALSETPSFGGADGDWLPDGNFPPSLGG